MSTIDIGIPEKPLEKRVATAERSKAALPPVNSDFYVGSVLIEAQPVARPATRILNGATPTAPRGERRARPRH